MDTATLMNEFVKAFYEEDFEKELDLYYQIDSQLRTNLDLKQLLSNNNEYQHFSQEMDDVSLLLGYLIDEEDWETIAEKNEISVSTKRKGEDFFIKCQAAIHCPAINLFAILREVDLLPSWIHTVKNSEVLFDPRENRRLLRYQYDLPWPLVNRESILAAKYIPMEELKSILIVMGSPRYSDYLGFTLPSPEKKTRMTIPLGGTLLKATENNECEIMFFSKTNTAVKFIPKAILNYITKSMFFNMMSELKNQAEKFDSGVYFDRVKEKQEFYGRMKAIFHDD